MIRFKTVTNKVNARSRNKIKKEALNFWQPIVKEIFDYVKARDAERFASLRILSTGSYYERAKVGKPDEFDLMLVIEVLEFCEMIACEYSRLQASEMTVNGSMPPGFAALRIGHGGNQARSAADRTAVAWRQWQLEQPSKPGRNPWQQHGEVFLNATQIKDDFARLVRDAIRALKYKSYVTVKSQGPAVTLAITDHTNGREYSVDLTLAFKIKSWPRDAEEWRRWRSPDGWPNPSLVEEICQDGCHVIAKHPKGRNLPGNDFLWRISFSAAEKKLFLSGEPSSCWKQVLRLLKDIKEKLPLEPLHSYHLKTILFYECEAYPSPSEWSYSLLKERFFSLLQRLENCLDRESCPHYFISSCNLFETFRPIMCSELATIIRKIRLKPGPDLIRQIYLLSALEGYQTSTCNPRKYELNWD